MILRDFYTKMEYNTSFLYAVATDKAKMLDTAKEVLKRMFNDLHLEAERTSVQFSTVSGTYLYSLDSRILDIINMRCTDPQGPIDFMSREDFEKAYPYPATTEAGQPLNYVPLEKLKCQNQPTASSVISITSSSASDITTYYVVVKGVSGGVLKTERLLLTGATPVLSTNSYTKVLSITKDTTNGTITATSNSAAVTNITLLPAEKEREYWQVRLHPIPDAVYVNEYTFHVTPWVLLYDEESIPLPDQFTTAFINECTADLLFKQGDVKSAQFELKGMATAQEIKDRDYSSQEKKLTFDFDD